MLHGLWIAYIISTFYQCTKDAFTPTVSAEQWGNKELIHKDRMSGMSGKQILKNVHNGKYVMSNKYPEPHRDPKTGSIIIENSLLYEEDVKKYGHYQAHQWVKQGKYNLTPEELEKEKERIRKHLKELYDLP